MNWKGVDEIRRRVAKAEIDPKLAEDILRLCDDHSFLTNNAKQMVADEKSRCAQICVKEYARWKDVDEDSYGIAVGAIGAASNILCAIEGIPSVSD